MYVYCRPLFVPSLSYFIRFIIIFLYFHFHFVIHHLFLCVYCDYTHQKHKNNVMKTGEKSLNELFLFWSRTRISFYLIIHFAETLPTEVLLYTQFSGSSCCGVTHSTKRFCFINLGPSLCLNSACRRCNSFCGSIGLGNGIQRKGYGSDKSKARKLRMVKCDTMSQIDLGDILKGDDKDSKRGRRRKEKLPACLA